MRFSSVRPAVLMFCAVAAATPAVAQTPAVARGPQADQMRVQIAVMERLLERAVNEGIVATRARVPEIASVPFMIVGNDRVRGFRIDGYGVFFDVEIPEPPPSMTWSIRVIARNNDAAIQKELADLKLLVARAITSEKDRADVQARIVRLQQRVTGVPPGMQTTHQEEGSRVVRTATGADLVQAPPAAETREPSEIYMSEVRNALINAILGQGTAIPLAGAETLTVAARGTGALLGEPDVATMYLTIKAQDLNAFRAGQITRDEAIKRIKENHF